jgi:hypothetical protein
MLLRHGSYLVATAADAPRWVWATRGRSDDREGFTQLGLWRVRLDGVSSSPGMLEDYTFLAEGMLTLYDTTGDRRWLDRAIVIVDETIERFWDGEGGGFFIGADRGAAIIARPKSPHDGAVPSPNAAALRALAMAFHRTGEPRYRERAEAVVAAFSGLVAGAPARYSYLLLGREELTRGDTGVRRYAARGNVAARVAAVRSGASSVRVELTLDIAPGWHVNSSAPLEESLIPTRLESAADARGSKLTDIVYPEGRDVKLGFQQAPLSVYTGQAAVTAELQVPFAVRADAAPVPLVLRLQACDDRRCLRPEELTLPVPIAALLRPADAPF